MKFFLDYKISTRKLQTPQRKNEAIVFSNRLNADSVCFSSNPTMNYTKKEQEAYNLAQKLFEGKYRKDKITPYFEHCKDVGNKLKESGYPEDTVSAGFLHDVTEEIKDWTTQKIEQLFGKKVANLVEEVSHKDPNADWDTKLKNAISNLTSMSTEGKALVASDKMSSIKDDIRAFKFEGDNVFDKLNAGPEKQLLKHLSFYKIIMSDNPPNEPLKSEYAENIKKYTQIVQSIIFKKSILLVA